jgi:hypothetical protein
MRKITIRFPDEQSMIELGQKMGIKHWTKKKTGTARPRTKLVYEKQESSLEEFFG